MASIDHRRLRVVKLVSLIDIMLALVGISYASFQFSHGENLIPGKLTSREKITRLAIYASLNYLFLLIQIGMALVLLRSTFKVMSHPVPSLQIFKTWRAWSSLYIIVLLLDAFVIGILMGHSKYRERKIISLAILVTQLLFRPIGIALVKKMEYLLSNDMGGVFKNQRSIVYEEAP